MRDRKYCCQYFKMMDESENSKETSLPASEFMIYGISDLKAITSTKTDTNEKKPKMIILA